MELVPDGTLNLFYEDDNLNRVDNILLKKQVRWSINLIDY